jgi:hypothetical protein
MKEGRQIYYYFIEALSKYCILLTERNASMADCSSQLFGKSLLFNFPAGELR